MTSPAFTFEPSLTEIMASTDIRYLDSRPELFTTGLLFSSFITIAGLSDADFEEFFQSITAFCLIPVDSSEISLKLIPSLKSSNSIMPEDSVIIGIVYGSHCANLSFFFTS